MIKLQSIILPSTKDCTEERMYFRKNDKVKYSLADDCITIKKNGILGFDTYFNAFFADSWFCYTNVKNVRVRLQIKGEVRVALFLHEKTADGINEKCVYESYYNSEVDGDYFDAAFDTLVIGMYSVRILCVNGRAEFISGFYYTDDNIYASDSKVNLWIKANNHNNYIYKNVERLGKNYKVFVLNDGETLDEGHFKSQNVSVIDVSEKNDKWLESLLKGKSGNEYALLLDDDVIVQENAIDNICVFLSLLKDENKNIIVEGDVFRRDLQWKVFNGADNCLIDDMRCLEQCLENISTSVLKFDAWWCAIVPYEVMQKGLKKSDVENIKRIPMIKFNGLCVWHEKINSLKQSAWYGYYFSKKKAKTIDKERCILQHFLMPEEKNCTEESLYFRRVGRVEYSLADSYIKLRNDAIVNFDTYFNGLSASKWLKYTKINNVKVHLEIEGKVRITLLYKEKTPSGILEKCICETYFDSEIDGEFFEEEYKTEFTKGMYCVSILSICDDTKFYGGYYYAEDCQPEDIGLAINICTFKREKYVYKNMKMLEDEFLLNKDSELNGRLYVNISDNAKTIDTSQFESDYIRVYENKNLGGAGGFTRCLIESKKMQDSCNLTHVLLMDDDVVMQPESIYRTYRILSLLKDEYKDSFVGGAMIRTDLQWFQTEAGGTWNAGQLISHKQGLDLRVLDACLYNEVEEKCDFNAWWYCTMPISVVREDNLPMPIFIRGDDVEFGLRNMKHLILMNGICVWHEPFENKYSSSMYYYIFRNRLIDNAVRGIEYSKEQFLADFREQYFREIFTLRYKNAQLLLNGVLDFLKGPEWLMEQDGEELNMSVMQAGYKFSDLNELTIPFEYPQYEQMLNFVEEPKEQKKRKLTLNGLFGKHDKAVCVPVQNPHIAYFYKAYGAVNYDAVSGKGFETYFNKKEEIELLKAYFKLKKNVNKKYDSVKEKYMNAKELLNGIKFWEKYLNINSNWK